MRSEEDTWRVRRRILGFGILLILIAGRCSFAQTLMYPPKITGARNGEVALLLGARTLLGAPGMATRSTLTTSNKKLLLY